jgi:membrane protein implicated in regulation of membrane protease activity
MNKYEQRAAQERKAALRSSIRIWTAGAALIGVAIAVLVVSSSAPSRSWSKSVILIAVLLLVLRQVGRRSKNKRSRVAEPDPQSRLKLD